MAVKNILRASDMATKKIIILEPSEKVTEFIFSNIVKTMEHVFPEKDNNEILSDLLHHPKIIAVCGSEIVGFALWKVKSEKKEIVFYLIGVVPGFRLMEIGRTMYTLSISALQKYHGYKITAHCRVKNKAIVFHCKMGLKISNTVHSYYKDGDDAHELDSIVGMVPKMPSVAVINKR